MAKTFLLVMVLTILSISTIASAQVEEITLSTYYPAPFGEYDELAADRFITNTQMIDPLSEEFNDMQQGDCHIGWSLIVGHGGTGFSYDELNTAGNLPGDGDVLIKGNVGIGTTSPAVKLQVESSDVIQTRFINTNTLANRKAIVGLLSDQGDPSGIVTRAHLIGGYDGDDNGYFAIGTRNSGIVGEKVRVDRSGNVGIGTTETGGANLDVHDPTDAEIRIWSDNATTSYDSYLNIKNLNRTWWVKNNADGKFSIWDNSVTQHRLTIDNSGNVGIGTTNPTEKLEVDGNVKASGYIGAVSVLDKNTTDVTVVNTTGQITIYSFTVPGQTLGTNNLLRLTLHGRYLKNAPGVWDGPTLRVRYGATTLIAKALSPATVDSANYSRFVITVLLNAEGATNAQFATAEYLYQPNPNANTGTVTLGHGTSSVNSTADQNLAVTWQWTNANPGISMTVEYALLEAIM